MTTHNLYHRSDPESRRILSDLECDLGDWYSHDAGERPPRPTVALCTPDGVVEATYRLAGPGWAIRPDDYIATVDDGRDTTYHLLRFTVVGDTPVFAGRTLV